jgi:two-component system response regulator FixJ
MLEARSDLPVLIMSGHGDVTVAVPAMQNGAVAFVEKPFRRAILGEALHIGFLKLDDPEGYAAYLEGARRRVEALREAERAVLAELARGRSNEAIGIALGLDPARLDVCRARLFSEAGLETVTDALRLAFASGLVQVQGDKD